GAGSTALMVGERAGRFRRVAGVSVARNGVSETKAQLSAPSKSTAVNTHPSGCLRRSCDWRDRHVSEGIFAMHGAKLRLTPTFALAAIASIAVGIGGNITVFSLVNAILLRP